MKRFFALVVVMLLAVMVEANDGIYYTTGNHLVPLVETDISVKKEVLTISLKDDGYAYVDVYYEFFNPQPTTKRLLMGFEAKPPYNDAWEFYPSGVHPYIYGFTVEMNGCQVFYQTAPCYRDTLPVMFIDTTKQYYLGDNNYIYEKEVDWQEHFDRGIDFAYIYYFDADFRPGLNIVHHTYRYKLSVIVGEPYRLDYKLTPATRWANGQVDDFTLVIRADNTAKHFVISQDAFPDATFQVTEGGGKVRSNGRQYNLNERFSFYEIVIRNGAVVMHQKDFRPQSELELMAANSYYNYIEQSESYYYYDRSSTGYLCTQKLPKQEHDFWVRVLHNMPYAHRGRVFKDPKLQKFFESLWWYMPDPNYKDNVSDFTPVDWEYVRYSE